jgi:hypothetical protein
MLYEIRTPLSQAAVARNPLSCRAHMAIRPGTTIRGARHHDIPGRRMRAGINVCVNLASTHNSVTRSAVSNFVSVN